MEKQIKKDMKQGPSKRTYRHPSKTRSAQEKIEAVLTVWSERRSPSQVCRETGITWTILNQWQERAMEGMLQALEPRVTLSSGQALSPRLRAMLERRQAAFSACKLAKRFAEVQKITTGRAVEPVPTEG